MFVCFRCLLNHYYTPCHWYPSPFWTPPQPLHILLLLPTTTTHHCCCSPWPLPVTVALHEHHQSLFLFLTTTTIKRCSFIKATLFLQISTSTIILLIYLPLLLMSLSLPFLSTWSLSCLYSLISDAIASGTECQCIKPHINDSYWFKKNIRNKGYNLLWRSIFTSLKNGCFSDSTFKSWTF